MWSFSPWGVRPESRLAKEAGLPCNAKGGILVDDHMRTEDENIYAVGDAVEITDFITGDKAMVPLAGPANKQGRIAADNICGLHSRYTGTQGSAVLKLFDMTIATTGLNERTAKAKGIDCDKVFLYSANHAGYYPGSTMMSMKSSSKNCPAAFSAHRLWASTAWTSAATCWPRPFDSTPPAAIWPSWSCATRLPSVPPRTRSIWRASSLRTLKRV